MPKYEVMVPEIHYQTVVIQAASKEEALASIRDGEGDTVEGALEYSCVHEEGLDNMILDIEHFDWAITEIEQGLCEKCEEDNATTVRFIGDEEVAVCDICAKNEKDDDDE